MSDPGSHAIEKDFCIRFSGASADGLKIWTTAAFLEQASPYFATLIGSDCSETVLRRSEGPRKTGVRDADASNAAGKVAVKDWADSDDETDAFVVRERLTAGSDDLADLEYRQITVHETAFSTYRAVLFYLKSRHIVFAPVRSSLGHSTSGDSTRTRNAYLSKYHDENPSLPLPVSPKSVYRLAHLLQLPDLQKLALKALSSSLTITGAIQEVASPTALAYDEVRKLLCSCLVKNLSAPNPAWTTLQEKAGQGELDSTAVILVDFITALIEARKEDA